MHHANYCKAKSACVLWTSSGGEAIGSRLVRGGGTIRLAFAAGHQGPIASASFVGHNRVVFNLKGNDYRLIVAIAYRLAVVYVKFIGTHREYDRVDAATVELE